MRIKAAFKALLAIALCVAPRLQARSSRERQVLAADSAFGSALLAGDTVALGRLLGDEWKFFHSNGFEQSRASFLGQFAEGRRSFRGFVHDSVTVHVYGDAAVLTARTTRAHTVNGVFNDSVVHTIYVWVMRDGRWQMVAQQATAVRAPVTKSP